MLALEKALEGGAREALVDVYTKTLIRAAQKLHMQHGAAGAPPQPDQIDDTMLM